VVAIDPLHDLVLLAVADAKAPPLKFGDSAKVAIGDHVFSVGNPKGLEGTFADGIVSGIREIGVDKILQITAPISPGSSGGPILGESGTVVGIAAATFKGGQNLNFAIPASYLAHIMTNTSSLVPFVTRKALPKEPNYLAALGESSLRGVELASFSWGDSYPAKGTYHKLDFVFRNKLREPVTNIRALIIVSDVAGNPCDFEEVKWPEARAGWADSYPVLPPGLAKPSDTAFSEKTFSLVGPNLSKHVEVRLLGFDIVEEKN